MSFEQKYKKFVTDMSESDMEAVIRNHRNICWDPDEEILFLWPSNIDFTHALWDSHVLIEMKDCIININDDAAVCEVEGKEGGDVDVSNELINYWREILLSEVEDTEQNLHEILSHMVERSEVDFLVQK